MPQSYDVVMTPPYEDEWGDSHPERIAIEYFKEGEGRYTDYYEALAAAQDLEIAMRIMDL